MLFLKLIYLFERVCFGRRRRVAVNYLLKVPTIDHPESENMMENPSQIRTQRIYTKISTVFLVGREIKWNYTLRMLNYNLLQLLKDSPRSHFPFRHKRVLLLHLQ
jgi:hypothetical protein